MLLAELTPHHLGGTGERHVYRLARGLLHALTLAHSQDGRGRTQLGHAHCPVHDFDFERRLCGHAAPTRAHEHVVLPLLARREAQDELARRRRRHPRVNQVVARAVGFGKHVELDAHSVRIEPELQPLLLLPLEQRQTAAHLPWLGAAATVERRGDHRVAVVPCGDEAFLVVTLDAVRRLRAQVGPLGLGREAHDLLALVARHRELRVVVEGLLNRRAHLLGQDLIHTVQVEEARQLGSLAALLLL